MTNQEHLYGEVEEGEEGIIDHGKKQLGVMSTWYSVQIMYHKIV